MEFVLRRSLRLLLSLVVGLAAGAATVVGLAWHAPQAVEAAQPQLPIRAAFYYPWFPETWGDGTQYHPNLGRYDSSDPAVIAQHIAWMQKAKIQAGIASWWGRGTTTDGRIPALEDAAHGTGFKWTLYYEPEGSSDPSADKIAKQLTYIKRHYVKGRFEYLRVNAKPVIFVYADANDGCGMADRWMKANKGRFYVVLKLFPGFAQCATQPDSWHQYGPATAYDEHLPYSAAVSPGFWKAGEAQPRLARDPARFAADVARMTASGAQWQLVTTFNEWGEGTAIEPATEWGQQYLDILAGSASPTPTSPPPPNGGVTVIFLENKERSSIVGSSSAPYLNSFRANGIDFTHYYGVTHPSLPNYLAFASGTTAGKNGTDSIRAGELSQTTLWKQLANAGVSWSVNEESMPSTCYSGTSSGLYQLKHNPATPFAEIFNSPTLCSHVVPYTSGVPSAQVNFITPNMCNDMHDCSIATGDAWLAARVPAMLQAGQTVVITFDEGSSGTNGGGNIYTVVDGPGIGGRIETGTYNHYSLLAALEARYGLAKLGGAASATPLPLK